MQQFLIGLQFLTRIQVVTQTVWTEEDFGKSVRYFPLVGAVLGIIYGLVAWGATYLLPQVGVILPHHLLFAVLVALPIILTGGIHCDGFMDTVDGVFSGRERERMLEIMKDSRVGAFGVVAFVVLVMFQYSALADVPEVDLPVAMFVMPIISRMMMVMAISLYPYARKEGMGKAFSEYTDKRTFILVFIYGLALVLPWGVKALIAVLVSLLFTACFCNYVTKKLGGVTGDVYGAVCTLCELLVLIAFTCKIPF